MHFVWRLTVTTFAFFAVAACGPSTEKLDEVMLYEGPVLRLKLVRYYQRLPFHYEGEVFRVQCASHETADSPAHETQEAGWVSLGNGSAIGSGSAAEIADTERDNYRVIDEQTLVWLGNGVNVTYDACGSFRAWYPTSIPEDLIETVEKPAHCKPEGTADCRDYDFIGSREPRFSDISVAPDGRISFVVRTQAIKDGRPLRVHSDDAGQTWRIERL